MATGEALSERELDLEMADALPQRDTLAAPVIVVAPSINVTTQVATATAVAVGGLKAVAVAFAANKVY